MEIKINITPMSMKNGVLGLPIDCCRHWNALKSVPGILVYGGIESKITFTPKHIDCITEKAKAKAWQFTINNSEQFKKLKLDGIYTYAIAQKCGEKFICDLTQLPDKSWRLEVKSVQQHNNTPEVDAILKKLSSFVQQGVRIQADTKNESAPLWNAPSKWIVFKEIEDYKEIRDCVYLWVATKPECNTKYLYVGIVGATRKKGQSKRTLKDRLKEEEKEYKNKYGLNIIQFRYCSLNNANGMDIPNLLKTIEMAEITVLSSLFHCEKSRDNITPLFENNDIVLLNSSTSYKFVD